MKKYILVVTLLIAVMTMAAQCGTVAAGDNATGAAKIRVMEPWSRPSPMKAGNGAVYMMLMNEGGSDDVLLSAATDVAEVVELHETKMEGDVMKMSPVPNIAVPAGGSARLEPGGKHIMLINLKRQLVPGEKIKLTLNFEKSGQMIVEAQIKEGGAAMPGMQDKIEGSHQ